MPRLTCFGMSHRIAATGLRCAYWSGGDALGAVLSIAAGTKTLRRDVRTGYSYLAANDPRVHVGLGDVTKVESITVRWADGTRERFGPFDVDRIVDIRRGGGIAQ